MQEIISLLIFTSEVMMSSFPDKQIIRLVTYILERNYKSSSNVLLSTPLL